MNDAGLRRLLERATVEPPADLEARVFRARRHPWRWTAAAAAVVLVAGVVGWSLAREPSDEVRLVSEPPAEQLAIRPIGETDFVATWLPPAFSETDRDVTSTTWSNPEGDSITVGMGRVLQVPKIGTFPEPLGPGYAAERGAASGRQWLVWCNGGSCSVETSGVSETDTLRVAVGVVPKHRLIPPEEPLGGETYPVPSLTGGAAPKPYPPAGPFPLRYLFRAAGASNTDVVLEQNLGAGVMYHATRLKLVVGAPTTWDGFQPLTAGDEIIGWMDNRIVPLDGPTPVVAPFGDSMLQGYLIPGEGFVWLDELFADRDVAPTTSTSIVAAGTVTNTAPGEFSFPYDHPAWGRVRVVTRQPSADGTVVGTASITVVDAAGATRWSSEAQLSELAPTGAAPRSSEEAMDVPVDKLGHLFLEYNPGLNDYPGGETGVIVLEPTLLGFEDFGTLPTEANAYTAHFMAGVAVDIDSDGAYEVVTRMNDCIPDCSQGTPYRTGVQTWDGSGYVAKSPPGEEPCGSMRATPGPVDDSVSNVRAVGVLCEAARELVNRVRAEHSFPAGPSSFTFGEFACTVTADDATLSPARYRCASDGRLVRWDRK
jgi:hypothetical protein